MYRGRIVAAGVVVWIAAAALAVSCGSQDDALKACATQEDCPTATVCSVGACRMACPCGPDEVCVDQACFPKTCGEQACEGELVCVGDHCGDPRCGGEDCGPGVCDPSRGTCVDASSRSTARGPAPSATWRTARASA